MLFNTDVKFWVTLHVLVLYQKHTLFVCVCISIHITVHVCVVQLDRFAIFKGVISRMDSRESIHCIQWKISLVKCAYGVTLYQNAIQNVLFLLKNHQLLLSITISIQCAQNMFSQNILMQNGWTKLFFRYCVYGERW